MYTLIVNISSRRNRDKVMSTLYYFITALLIVSVIITVICAIVPKTRELLVACIFNIVCLEVIDAIVYSLHYEENIHTRVAKTTLAFMYDPNITKENCNEKIPKNMICWHDSEMNKMYILSMKEYKKYNEMIRWLWKDEYECISTGISIAFDNLILRGNNIGSVNIHVR